VLGNTGGQSETATTSMSASPSAPFGSTVSGTLYVDDA
jgi:hypothetical protein